MKFQQILEQLTEATDDKVYCPHCDWEGKVSQLKDKACPKCGAGCRSKKD